MLDYTVIQPNRSLLAQAWEQLRGMWKQMALAVAVTCLIYFLIYLPSFIFDILGIEVPMVLDLSNSISANLEIEESTALGITLLDIIESVVSGLITGSLYLGFAGYFLKRIRGLEISIKNIFDGFKRFGSSFLLMFFQELFILLWGLLLIVPGIIKGLGYSMAFFIMYDNPGIKPLEALKKSSIMMNGYKWKLFKPLLGIAGVYFVIYLLLDTLENIPDEIYDGVFIVVALPLFLCIIIAFLGLAAYTALVMANFYENLKMNQEKALAQDTVAETSEISPDSAACASEDSVAGGQL